jgi:hypothetical protein
MARESTNSTSTPEPANVIAVTEPVSMPATRTGAPTLRPGTSANRALRW